MNKWWYSKQCSDIFLIVATLIIVSVMFLAGCENSIVTPTSVIIASSGSISVYFCPVDNCRQAILDQINAAQSEIHMTMYSLTDDAVGDALVAAANRGVDIAVYLELGQISKYSEASKLVAAGIPVRQDTNSAYMHNKYVIIDGQIVMTGSVNYSGNGFDENNENLIIIRNTEIASKYNTDFNRLYSTGIDWVGG
jgi:phosphatidylserine/phosphatidylglycerophosphate/cardiolipin synthase-like enzyme